MYIYITTFSIIQAILTSNLLICICTFIMKRKKLLYRMPYNSIVILLLLAMVRLFFPFYFGFSHVISFSQKSMQFLLYPSRCVFQSQGYYFSAFDIFCTVWGIGVIIMTFCYLRKEVIVTRFIAGFGTDMSKQEPYASILAELAAGHRRGNVFRIYRIPGVSAPFIRGVIQPAILIPENMELNEQELYYVLAHEVSHYRHLDTLIKQLLQLTSILFWWNPACHILNRQADLMFELRVDHTVTRNNRGTVLEYLQCILNIAEQACEPSEIPEYLYIGFAKREDAGMLTKRVHYLIEKAEKPGKIGAFVALLSAAFLFIASVTFAFRVQDYDTQTIYFDLTPQNSYIIEKEDGTYDIYHLNQYDETVTSLMGYDTSIPVYRENEYERRNSP